MLFWNHCRHSRKQMCILCSNKQVFQYFFQLYPSDVYFFNGMFFLLAVYYSTGLVLESISFSGFLDAAVLTPSLTFFSHMGEM